MSAAELTAAYASALQTTVTVRRYTGTGGSRTPTDYTARGHVRQMGAAELVGSVVENNLQVIVLATDLTGGGCTLPLTSADRVVIGGRELSILVPGSRYAADGTVIACDLQVRG
jgi:hypothetical protein